VVTEIVQGFLHVFEMVLIYLLRFGDFGTALQDASRCRDLGTFVDDGAEGVPGAAANVDDECSVLAGMGLCVVCDKGRSRMSQ